MKFVNASWREKQITVKNKRRTLKPFEEIELDSSYVDMYPFLRVLDDGGVTSTIEEAEKVYEETWYEEKDVPQKQSRKKKKSKDR